MLEKNYSKIKNIILMLSTASILREKIIIVGGTVPYLVSNKPSSRKHSDIDIIVDNMDMPFIRKYLKEAQLYSNKLDSKFSHLTPITRTMSLTL